MSYAQNWVENQPTTATLANTIWQYWQNNQIAIRERLDSLFGTTNWSSADPYQAALFDMRGSITSRIIGGSTSWGVTAVDGVTDNFVILNNGNVAITGNLTVTGGTLTGVSTFATAATFSGNVAVIAAQAHVNEYSNGSVSGSATVNWNNSNNQTLVLTANTTLTFSNPTNAGFYILRIVQDATGSRLITWPTVKWASAVAPTLSTGANKTDFISFYYDGTSYNGFWSGFNY